VVAEATSCGGVESNVYGKRSSDRRLKIGLNCTQENMKLFVLLDPYQAWLQLDYMVEEIRLSCCLRTT